MHNSFKIARWEIKRHVKQRAFWLSMLLTPVIFALFLIVPLVLNAFSSDPPPLTLHVYDELGIWTEAAGEGLTETGEWYVTPVTADQTRAIMTLLAQAENTLYLPLTEQTLADNKVLIYSSPDVELKSFAAFQFLARRLDEERLSRLGITGAEAAHLLAATEFELKQVNKHGEPGAGTSDTESTTDPLQHLIPAVFAGVILLSVIISGMMIFQSASEEKKEKLSEILLSSVTTAELMQGKIFGYFVLGMLQVAVWMALTIPLIYWRYDFPLLQYVLVPEMVPLLFYALAGYLLFAALFVAMGATVEDLGSASNFQGMVFMLPWLPLMFAIPVINDPYGTVARIGSYFPLTTPGVMLIRLAVSEQWPWGEIAGTAIVLVISIWLLMKMAGKIFKVGMLMYGKNASAQEIWRWLRY